MAPSLAQLTTSSANPVGSRSRKPHAQPHCSSRTSSRRSRARDGNASLSSRRHLLEAAVAIGAGLAWQRPAYAVGAVPKAYEDTALRLVDALREAISTDLSDAEERQVRRAADPAKSLVREFLTRWQGNGFVEGEESYRQLSSAIQLLGTFYQQNGQRSRLSSEVGQAVLDKLDAAEAALPMREDKVLPLRFF